jgi:hypothetical protein
MTLPTMATVLLTTLLAAADPQPAKNPTPPPLPVPGDKTQPAGESPLETALKDARSALLIPCTPEMATGRVTKVSVVKPEVVNEAIKKEKSKRAPASPGSLYLSVDYRVGDKTEHDFRQVNAAHHLTSEQAQGLVGAKVCVVRYGLSP